jgi:hypothetical protein
MEKKLLLFILFISTIIGNSAFPMFIEGEPQEISVLQAKLVLELDSFSVYERTFKATCTDGSPSVLRDLEEDHILKGFWAKSDKAWLFSYISDPSSGTSPNTNTRKVMFFIKEIKG